MDEETRAVLRRLLVVLEAAGVDVRWDTEDEVVVIYDEASSHDYAITAEPF